MFRGDRWLQKIISTSAGRFVEQSRPRHRRGSVFRDDTFCARTWSGRSRGDAVMRTHEHIPVKGVTDGNGVALSRFQSCPGDQAGSRHARDGGGRNPAPRERLALRFSLLSGKPGQLVQGRASGLTSAGPIRHPARLYRAQKGTQDRTNDRQRPERGCVGFYRAGAWNAVIAPLADLIGKKMFGPRKQSVPGTGHSGALDDILDSGRSALISFPFGIRNRSSAMVSPTTAKSGSHLFKNSPRLGPLAVPQPANTRRTVG